MYRSVAKLLIIVSTKDWNGIRPYHSAAFETGTKTKRYKSTDIIFYFVLLQDCNRIDRFDQILYVKVPIYAFMERLLAQKICWQVVKSLSIITFPVPVLQVIEFYIVRKYF